MSKLLYIPPVKVFTERKAFVPFGNKCFSFSVDPFSEPNSIDPGQSPHSLMYELVLKFEHFIIL